MLLAMPPLAGLLSQREREGERGLEREKEGESGRERVREGERGRERERGYSF